MTRIIRASLIWYAPAVNEGIDIAQQVRSGTQSAAGVTAGALARARQAQGKLNAFVTLLEDGAASQAAAIDTLVSRGQDPGVLAGVPLAIKDNICVAGAPTTAASRMLEDFVPPFTATVVERLVAAGGVVIGKAGLDEFAMGGSNEFSAFGPVRNPWDPERVPGGSSGGSAAAVAAGVVPVALGTDTGGSVRQPAAFCGLIGFKPTYGLLSRYGVMPLASSLDHVGVFTRSTADLLVTLQAMAGPDALDSTTVGEASLAAGALPGKLPAGAGLEGLRVGVLTDLDSPADAPDLLAALAETVTLLQQLGASVQDFRLPSVRFAAPAYLLLCAAEASSNLARMDGMTFGVRTGGDALGQEEVMQLSRGAMLGPEVRRRILLGGFVLAEGRQAAHYGRAVRARTLISSELDAAFTDFDVILSLTAPSAAYPLGGNGKTASGESLSTYRSGTSTVLANLAGLPAVSVPGARSGEGLPVGMQFMAPRFADAVLLRVTAALEELRGADFAPVAPV
jgi:aspartyl-tRNA(Asn)/glutamyl-tRNA(Gln) amidotransferase subunit A